MRPQQVLYDGYPDAKGQNRFCIFSMKTNSITWEHRLTEGFSFQLYRDGVAVPKSTKRNNDSPFEHVLVFYLSDSTGVTAETLGGSITAQFPEVQFDTVTVPFIANPEQARDIVSVINGQVQSGNAVIVFCTIMSQEINTIIVGSKGIHIDLISGHIASLEMQLGLKAKYAIGLSHGQGDLDIYQRRMKAVEYAIEHDDGQSLRNLGAADVILIGPSRSGKTPTSMYLALQHGLFVANYPLLEEDYEVPGIPAPLVGMEKHLVGMTTTVARLNQVRTERRPGSKYASLEQCAFEIKSAENLYLLNQIPAISAANMSVEEMSAVILYTLDLPGINNPLLDKPHDAAPAFPKPDNQTQPQ